MAARTLIRQDVHLLLRLALAGALALGLATTPLLAQAAGAPTFVYETIYNGAEFDAGRDIAVDAAGNAYVLARAYDANNDVLVLKLDPSGAVVWDAYLRGSAGDFGRGIAVDGAGGVYITGWTDSADFPILNAMQPVPGGLRDGFLTKLSAEDGALLFSTFFGGNRSDGPNDIVVNAAGEIFLVGYTESTNFPTVNPIQDALNTTVCFCADAFVSKVSADGGTLLYSTYLGGGLDDEGMSLGIDAGENIYLAGDTKSSDFPLVSAIQPTYGGGFRDAFVARISADGSALQYSTFLGGEEWDRVARIAVDPGGSTFVSGSTQSIGFPTTAGAFQPGFAGGIDACGNPPFEPLHNCDDAFVTQITPDGQALAYSTFVGGSKDDIGRGISLDGSGRATLVGYTHSADFPGAPGPQTARIVLWQLSASGGDLTYTVAIDSPVGNDGHGITLDGAGAVLITGAQNVPSDTYVAKLAEGEPLPAIFVGNIKTKVRIANPGPPTVYKLQGRVPVYDQDRNPIAGATVTAQWELPGGQIKVRTATTRPNGSAYFKATSPQEGVYTLTVLDVQADDYLYDPDMNYETSEMLTVP